MVLSKLDSDNDTQTPLNSSFKFRGTSGLVLSDSLDLTKIQTPFGSLLPPVVLCSHFVLGALPVLDRRLLIFEAVNIYVLQVSERRIGFSIFIYLFLLCFALVINRSLCLSVCNNIKNTTQIQTINANSFL